MQRKVIVSSSVTLRNSASQQRDGVAHPSLIIVGSFGNASEGADVRSHSRSEVLFFFSLPMHFIFIRFLIGL
jgi:hypothetical protein